MSLPPSPQVAAAAGNPADYFLCEEKVPLLKERSEVKRCAQHRPLAPEEEVVRLVWGWTAEEGYVGRICLKLRDEVRAVSKKKEKGKRKISYNHLFGSIGTN